MGSYGFCMSGYTEPGRAERSLGDLLPLEERFSQLSAAKPSRPKQSAHLERETSPGERCPIEKKTLSRKHTGCAHNRKQESFDIPDFAPYCSLMKLNTRPFISKVEIAERWDCDRKTVYRRLKLAGIKPIRFSGRSITYRLDDICRRIPLSESVGRRREEPWPRPSRLRDVP
jgi:hypothetical protein